MSEEWQRENGKEDKGKKFSLGNSKLNLEMIQKKPILIILICLGLLTLIWPMAQKPNSEAIKTGESFGLTSKSDSSVKSQLAQEVEGILSQIDGAGKVSVSLTLASDGVKTYATNKRDERRETQETDRSGGDRSITEENQIRDLAVSAGSALLLEEKAPEVIGVLVVAEGAINPDIKEKLTDATSTLLNISLHQVRVMPRKGDI